MDAAAGAGTKPLNTPGKVYLAGPIQGRPLSLVVVVPALAGPYDLGNIAVRAAVDVDPTTTQVTVVSDPPPQIYEGVPLRTRMIQVNLDRPNFTINPTNCQPFNVVGTFTGEQGTSSSLSAPFQVANCRDLDYGPKLTMSLKGGLNRLGHPAIKAVLKTKPGEANSRRVSVTLPDGQLLDNSHIGAVCTRRAVRRREHARRTRGSVPRPRGRRCSTRPCRDRSTSAPPAIAFPTSSRI